MATITTRAAKGSALTHAEVDGNFTNLNTDKLDTAGIAAGSAASPTIKFTGDTNTGLYSPGADQVAISTGGTGRLFVDSSGRVGIGTASPSTLFHASGSGNVSTFTTTSFGGIVCERTNTVGAGSTHFVIDFKNSDSTVASLSTINTSGSTSSTGTNYRLSIAAGDAISLTTNSSERLRIDSSGRLLVGTSTARSNFLNSTVDARAQIERAGEGTGELSLVRNANSTSGPLLLLGKSRGTTVGSNTIVSSGDQLGWISFGGADGTEFVQGATIIAEVDGTPGANDMPGRLVFSTTADGASSPTERMRIDSSGHITIATGGNILADFSNATLTSRTYFQNSTANTTTTVGAIPNGTATSAGLLAFNNSNPTNASYVAIVANAAACDIRSSVTGTGTFLPLDFYTNNVSQLRIDTSGNLTLSTGNNILADFSNATLTSRTYFQTSTANGSTTVSAIPNGTGTSSGFLAFNNATPTNASYLGLVGASTTVSLRSAAAGTGTFLPLLFETNNQEQARFTTTDRYFQMASGTGGIQFNGDTAAANALDDYEEGTWTPVIAGTTLAGTGTYVRQVARYTKIGNRVCAEGIVQWSAHTGTGNIKLTGLPFTTANVANYVLPVTLHINNITSPASTTVQAYVTANSSEIVFTSVAIAGGTFAALAMDTAGEFVVSVSYTV